MNTTHKQVKITVDSPMYDTPFSFRADNEIAGLLHDLNYCGVQTIMSCAHNTDDTVWLYLSEQGYRNLMEIAFQFHCQGDDAGSLFSYLDSNLVVNMVNVVDGKLEYNQSIRIERNKVDWFTRAIHEVSKEISI